MPDDHGRDTVYAEPRERTEAFRFDGQVADVFADMIARSVPGYALTLQMIEVAARRYARGGTRCYDLGCSLGASTLGIRRQVPADCHIVGIDNSAAMTGRARAIVAADRGAAPVEILTADVRDVSYANASLVAINFTLQFIPPQDREALLRRLRDALQPGGCLVLSEKIAFADAGEQALLAELHHEFKALQGYSSLEIAQKRNALENVLIPETIAAHRDRLLGAGFRRVTVWLQCLNFASLLAET